MEYLNQSVHSMSHIYFAHYLEVLAFPVCLIQKFKGIASVCYLSFALNK